MLVVSLDDVLVVLVVSLVVVLDEVLDDVLLVLVMSLDELFEGEGGGVFAGELGLVEDIVYILEICCKMPNLLFLQLYHISSVKL